MPIYRPRAQIRVTATVNLARSGDRLEEVVFFATPRSVTVERNDFNTADTCQVEFDAGVFPVLPRNLRQALVQVYLGDVRPGDDIDDRNLQFIGYVDEPELGLSESDSTLRWKARDYTALLIDAKRPAASLIPSYQENLRTALRRILDAVPGGSALKLRLEMDGAVSEAWPDLGAGAPPGLKAAKIPVAPQDGLWDLVKRACDGVNLIPRFDLDTLVVASSRGHVAGRRRPRFVYGANLVDYREKRALVRVREGIGLNALDLTTGRFITAVYPPAGDDEIARNPKATPTATAAKGKKKPPAVGSNGTTLNSNDKRHWFPHPPVQSEAELEAAAERIYKNRINREFEGSFKCARMRVDDVDVLTITAGDRVVVDVLPNERQLLGGCETTSERIDLLVRRGYQRSVASTLARAFESGTREPLEVFVRRATMSLSEADGFALSVDFQNVIEG